MEGGFMSFVDAIKSCFTQYVGFSGRARRSEYWFFCLFTFIIGGVFSILGRFVGFFGVLSTIFSLAVLLPSIAVLVRRLQDIGKKWTNIFFILIPIVGLIMIIVWCVKDSVPGANEFGPNPKGVN